MRLCCLVFHRCCFLGGKVSSRSWQSCEVRDEEEGRQVAVKVEEGDTRSPKLRHETILLRILDGGPDVGIPRVHYFGSPLATYDRWDFAVSECY